MFENIDKNRWISGIVITVVIIASALIGGILLRILCLSLSVLAAKELAKTVGLEKSPLLYALYAIETLLFVLLPVLHSKSILLCGFLALAVFAAILLYRYPQIPLRHLTLFLFAYFYIAVGLCYLAMARNMEGGLWILLLIYGCSLLGDVFGYLVGKRFGKHKMTPLISPKKTFEGLAGEVIGVSLFALLYGLLIQSKLEAYNLPVLVCFLSGIFGCLFAVAGDLFASLIKREYAIKDFSNLIPGHGGILDRIDSVLFTAPFIAILFYLFEK